MTSYTTAHQTAPVDNTSLWEQKSSLLSLFSEQVQSGLDQSWVFKTLEDLYHIEPFAVLQAVAFTPKSLKVFSSFLAQNPSYKKPIVNSYNWDERFYMYGSLNAGILMVKEGRLDLLKYCVKEGLFVEWQDHRGKNLLFYACQSEDPTPFPCPSAQRVRTIKQKTKILKFLLGLKQSKALLEKKDWSGRTAYETYLENKDIVLRKIPDDELKNAFQEWDSMWQKKILSLTLNAKNKPKSPARKI